MNKFMFGACVVAIVTNFVLFIIARQVGNLDSQHLALGCMTLFAFAAFLRAREL